MPGRHAGAAAARFLADGPWGRSTRLHLPDDGGPQREPCEHEWPGPTLGKVVVGEQLPPGSLGDGAPEAELERDGQGKPPGPDHERIAGGWDRPPALEKRKVACECGDCRDTRR